MSKVEDLFLKQRISKEQSIFCGYTHTQPFCPNQLFHKYTSFVTGGGLSEKNVNILMQIILSMEKKYPPSLDPILGQLHREQGNLKVVPLKVTLPCRSHNSTKGHKATRYKEGDRNKEQRTALKSSYKTKTRAGTPAG